MNPDYIKSTILQVIALIGLHWIAFVYDGEWIKFAVGVDVAMLGFQFSTLRSLKGVKNGNGSTNQ